MTDKPKRVQRQRTKGWRMPSNTVYVGRPTKYGNPFRMWRHTKSSRLAVVEKFRRQVNRPGVYGAEFRRAVVRELRGKNLACWCPLDQPCHADVLLELANAELAGESV